MMKIKKLEASDILQQDVLINKAMSAITFKGMMITTPETEEDLTPEINNISQDIDITKNKVREAENTMNKDLEGISNMMIKETMTIDRRENIREDIDTDQMIIEVIYKYIHIILEMICR
jgi:hypothetical protein